MKKILAATAIAFACSSAYAADVVDTAIASGNFKTLVTALKAAGLVDTLKGTGPFTVFAPNDAAFAKIPKDQLDALLKDKAKLTKILTYHVVPGKMMSSAIQTKSQKTVEGASLNLTNTNGKVMVDQANVIQADIVADNGVIHVIDIVLQPK